MYVKLKLRNTTSSVLLCGRKINQNGLRSHILPTQHTLHSGHFGDGLLSQSLQQHKQKINSKQKYTINSNS